MATITIGVWNVKRPAPPEVDYRLGYAEGRSGKPYPEHETAEFKRGWLDGESALEEAENGFQMWGRSE